MYDFYSIEKAQRKYFPRQNNVVRSRGETILLVIRLQINYQGIFSVSSNHFKCI